MTIKDWKEISLTAIVTATLTAGLLATRPGMSIDQTPKVVPSQPFATIGSLKVSATAMANADTVTAAVHIANSASTMQTGRFDVALDKTTFTGNPAGRVLVPTDFKEIELSRQTVERKIGPNGSTDVDLSFKLPAQTGRKPTMTTYRIDIGSGNKEVAVASAMAVTSLPIQTASGRN